MRITAAKEQMYHGTSSKFLRTILKKGLIPKTKKKVWDERKVRKSFEESRKGGRVFQDLESFPGIYFTTNYFASYSAGMDAVRKFGGNAIIIIAQLETQTPQIVIDEDFANFEHIIPPHGDAAARSIDLDTYKVSENVIDSWWNKFKRDEIESKYKFYPRELLRLKNYFADAIEAYVYYRIYTMSEGNAPWYPIRDIYEHFQEKDFDTLRRNYRQKYDKFIRKAQFLAQVPSGRRFMHNVRVTEPVNYRGKNRILCVFEIHEDRSDNSNWIEVHYCKKPVAFEKALKEHSKGVGEPEKVEM